MKTQEQWFAEYAVSHQNETNLKIHKICVPLIFWSIAGLLVSIPSGFLMDIVNFNNPYFINWASFIFLPIMVFYVFNLSAKNTVLMFLFAAFSVGSTVYIDHYVNILWISLAVFVLAWIGQFYGHKIEGKKPSFLQDLEFLLIGPAWVFEKMTR
jgi:uncharacterized membrane protein YGL010W